MNKLSVDNGKQATIATFSKYELMRRMRTSDMWHQEPKKLESGWVMFTHYNLSRRMKITTCFN